MMNIETMAAHLEIQQVLFRYCRGVDRGDRALIRSVYHADAYDDHGSYKGSGPEFADYIVDAMDRSRNVGQHHITNALIEVDGDVAQVESYFIAWHPVTLEATGEDTHAFAAGRYLDRFERRDGAWKIADRRVLMDITRTPEKPAPWAAEGMFAPGGRRERDPSHGRIGRV